MNQTTMPQPPGISSGTLTNPNLCRRYGQVVTAYDPDNQCGGIFNIETRQWALYWPVTMECFADQAAKLVSALVGDDAPREAAPLLLN